MSSSEIRARLMELAEERVQAEYMGLSADGAYMADLEEEILTHRAALVGAAVTELAVLYGLLYGRNLGSGLDSRSIQGGTHEAPISQARNRSGSSPMSASTPSEPRVSACCSPVTSHT